MTNQQQCEIFFKSRKSIILSTLDSLGTIETSVAPFVYKDDKLYIFVSELAKHTQNLLGLIERNESSKDLNTPGLVSAILLADESQTEQIFARERMTLQLNVAELLADDKSYSDLLNEFANQFGEVVSVLRGLSDFHLFEFIIQKGGYVKGFGQAFAFEDRPCKGLQPISRN
ncbi:MAG: hypothetical protein U9N57_11055 [Pseudomonadota bacterium]|nr:hypothetical protein [Pseudomonadota bacterium]